MTKKPSDSAAPMQATRADVSASAQAKLALEQWQEQNREAFESYNRFIEKHGIGGKKYRSW
jgi:post-segregation antitoxin (ccd killing protein)